MAETVQTSAPINPDSEAPKLLRWLTVALVVGVSILVKISTHIDPGWLTMHFERRNTMMTPDIARKPPNPALLADYPALPTGWHGAPIPLFRGQSPPDRWSVNLGTGAFVHVQTDVYLPDVIPINLSRTYTSFDDWDRDFGRGTSASYEIYLLGDNVVFSFLDMDFPDGSTVHMPRISPGTNFDATYEHRAAPGDTTDIFDQAQLWWRRWWYFSRLKDGTGIVFPSSRWAKEWGQRSAIMIQDDAGDVLDIKRDEAGNIMEIRSPNGRKLILTHDRENRITSANDSQSYAIYYTYDRGGHLTHVGDSNGESTDYTYDADDNMLTIKRPDGRTWLANTYDNRHRVIAQTYLDGGQALYSYRSDPLGTSTTEVTRPDGSIDRYTFGNDDALMNHARQAPPRPAKTDS